MIKENDSFKYTNTDYVGATVVFIEPNTNYFRYGFIVNREDTATKDEECKYTVATLNNEKVELVIIEESNIVVNSLYGNLRYGKLKEFHNKLAEYRLKYTDLLTKLCNGE